MLQNKYNIRKTIKRTKKGKTLPKLAWENGWENIKVHVKIVIGKSKDLDHEVAGFFYC